MLTLTDVCTSAEESPSYSLASGPELGVSNLQRVFMSTAASVARCLPPQLICAFCRSSPRWDRLVNPTSGTRKHTVHCRLLHLECPFAMAQTIPGCQLSTGLLCQVTVTTPQISRVRLGSLIGLPGNQPRALLNAEPSRSWAQHVRKAASLPVYGWQHWKVPLRKDAGGFCLGPWNLFATCNSAQQVHRDKPAGLQLLTPR